VTDAERFHPPPHRLEAWHAGEPDDEVAAHLETCDACRAHVEALTLARDALLARQAPEEVVRMLRTRADERSRPTRRRWIWLAAAGAAGVLVFALLLLSGPAETLLLVWTTFPPALINSRETWKRFSTDFVPYS
jgi:anti-sigma factor RsiW